MNGVPVGIQQFGRNLQKSGHPVAVGQFQLQPQRCIAILVIEVGLDAAGLEAVLSEIREPILRNRISDLYPLTPMQQGIFYHALKFR